MSKSIPTFYLIKMAEKKTFETPAATIKAMRAELGITQVQLAERLGLGIDYIKQMESDNKSVSGKKVAEIAEALGLKVTVRTTYTLEF